MNTFNIDSFTSKVVSDLGQVASGQGGRVNLIPALPGMGLLATLREGSQTLARDGVSSILVNLEAINDSLPGESAREQIEDLLLSQEAQLIIIDGGSMKWNEETLKGLTQFVDDKSSQASVWVVGGNIDALAEALPDKSTRFSVVNRTRIAKPTDNGTAPSGPKPKR